MKAVIVGGTGTLGTALVEELYGHDIVVFSRDELKQQQMRQRFPDVKYVIGDVRDRQSLRAAMMGADTVFHLAAIKHIDVAERNPLEAVKTNFIGTVNVADVAIEHDVENVVFSNTDKAVLPITTYGYTKALAQNYLLGLNGQSDTKFSVFNWGNIVASRGSVIPTFVSAINAGGAVPITHPDMSRFWLAIETAAKFMVENYKNAPCDRALIPPVKAASVSRVVESIARLLGVKKFSVKYTGIRGTEKIYEVLESRHDGCIRSDTCEQYTDEELDLLLKPTILGISDEKVRRLRPGKESGRVRENKVVQVRL